MKKVCSPYPIPRIVMRMKKSLEGADEQRGEEESCEMTLKQRSTFEGFA